MRVIRAEQLTRGGGKENHALEQHCIYTAQCEIAGVTMELCTDVADVARLFMLRYADHPACKEPDFRYFVATVRGGYAFWCAHAPAWRWTQGVLPPDAIAFLADSVALAAIVRFDPALASMQAACVELGGVAAGLAGHSASGKTATLLACARRGMRIYSDERTVLRNTIAYPYLRRNSVRAAGARLLLADQAPDPRRDPLHSEPQLSLKTCFGAEAIADPKPLRALFVIGGSGYCAALEAIDTASAMPAVMRWFDAHGDMVDRATRAISILNGVQCYKLTLGSPDESAAAMAYAMMRVAQRP
ncbi:MAG TPA: hypothetical protein VJP85_06530 [Candidatus Baltobacteraceae bacterium]|nr:hypothetical protein [Candidatus Baltobacteraceae bacterium]